MLGVGKTVKLTPLLSTPLAWTTTLPVVAPVGTGALILVALQLVGVAVVPLNLTVLLPCVLPKFDPAIVTEVPTAPDVGDRLLMLGVPRTVKDFPLLPLPDTVTTTLPVVAPEGTMATMLVALQLVTDAVLPLNLTVLLPCVVPNPVPVIVTEAPTAPEVGLKLVIEGAAMASRAPRKSRTERKRIVLHVAAVRGDMDELLRAGDRKGALTVGELCARVNQ